MAPIVCRAVSDVDFGAFTDAFNLAYSDYFTPIMMSVPAFHALIARDNIDLTASVVALDNETIVGTGLLGIRDQRGWIGGMGVIPERRRQGIGRHMMHYLLDRARERQLDTVQLEVIEANHGAHALYREIGFEDMRFLLILTRDPNVLPDIPAPYPVEERPVDSLFAYYDSFHEVENCWQRGLQSLKGLAHHIQGWVVLENGDVAGYASGWANEFEVRLADFATRPDSEQILVAQSLLAYLHHNAPDAHGASYNIADDDPVLPAYEALGYTTSFRQIEMKLAL